MTEPAELKQHCPYCNGKIAYPPDLAGRVAMCPHCRREVKLSREVKQTCRECSNEISFLESMLGEETRCPHCGNSMRLHRPAAEAAEHAATAETEGTGRHYFLLMRGKSEGPFSEAEVCSYIEAGHVSIDTRVQVGEAGVWNVLSEFQQFAAAFQKQNAPQVQEEEFVDEAPPEIMVLIGSQQHGPYTIGQIRHAAKTGTIDGRSPAQRPGMAGWVPLMKWDEFKHVNFAYISQKKYDVALDEGGGADHASVAQGYKYIAISFCCCAPVAIGGFIYGIKNIADGEILHGIVQIILSGIVLLLWAVAASMSM